MKKFKIILTENQLKTIFTALSEYSEICEDGGTEWNDILKETVAAKASPTSRGIAKAMQQVSDSLRRQTS